MIFATFSSSFYRKQRLLEMFASSNIETYNDPIRYKRKSLKRRNKTEHSKATSDLIRNRDFASEKLHKNNHDIELEISREQAHNLLKIADSANKEERKQNLKGRNIELLSKIRTGSSAFSAIPCKELKFKNRHMSITNRSKTGSQEIGSRSNSNKQVVNGQSSTKSKEKISNEQLNNLSEIQKEVNSSYVRSLQENFSSNRENGEYNKYSCFTDYVKDLKTKHKTPTMVNSMTIQQRIEIIRKKENLYQSNQNNSAFNKPKTAENNENYKNTDEFDNRSICEVEQKEEELLQEPNEDTKEVVDEGSKVPKLEISQIKSISNADAIKYELILKEMIEIENQLSFNHILIHYNLFESWCNNVISGLKLKEEEFQNRKYNCRGLSPKIEDIMDKVTPNQIEIFASSLK